MRIGHQAPVTQLLVNVITMSGWLRRRDCGTCRLDPQVQRADEAPLSLAPFNLLFAQSDQGGTALLTRADIAIVPPGGLSPPCKSS